MRSAAPAHAGVQRQHLTVATEADVYSAALQAYTLAQLAGASTLLATESATLTSELGMNIVKYAGRGSLTLTLQPQPRAFIEVLAEDRGPGIANLDLALTERYSSRGTLGLGLPAVRRMADTFEIQSTPLTGTRVRARRWLQGPAPSATPDAAASRSHAPGLASAGTMAPGAGWQHSLVQRPCFGEVVSGDGHLVLPLARGGMLAGVLDVLGHGADAHQLARHCERWLRAHAQADLVALVQGLHAEVRGSQGLALTLVVADHERQELRVCGVGNTRLFCLGTPGHRVEAQPGIVGGSSMPRLRPTRLPLQPRDTLVLVSDGINERLTLDELQTLAALPMQQIARQLLRTHGKTYDDATCLVLRCSN